MRRRQFVTGMALAAFGTGPSHAEQPRRIVMATLVGNQGSFAARWLELIYTDAFQQLGIALEIRAFPAARAAAEAAAGKVDGELARSYEYQATQNAMTRVSEPTIFASTAAYVCRQDIVLAPGWKGLRGTNYRVEYRAGYSVVAGKLAAVVPPERLSSVPAVDTGLRKLIRGRTDVYVDIADIVDSALVQDEFRQAGIRQAAVLERGPIHAYLNKRHADLGHRLALILKRMRDNGQIERYRLQAMHQK